MTSCAGRTAFLSLKIPNRPQENRSRGKWKRPNMGAVTKNVCARPLTGYSPTAGIMMISLRKCGPRAMRSKRAKHCPSAHPAGTASLVPISWGPTIPGRPCGSAVPTGAGDLQRRKGPFPTLAGRSTCSLTFKRRWRLAKVRGMSVGRRFLISKRPLKPSISWLRTT